jgi:hypothetical protein
MILQEIVNVLKEGSKPSDTIANTTEARIMRHAKIVISTLNYCGSTRMERLKKSTAFVIIDEGKSMDLERTYRKKSVDNEGIIFRLLFKIFLFDVFHSFSQSKFGS